MTEHGTAPATGDSETALVEHMVELADAWLATLDAPQRARALWAPFGEDRVEEERIRWFYTPTDHGGVALGELAPRQQSLMMQLVATALTRPAYVTLCTILGMENVLDELQGWHVDWGRERGRDPGLYWIRVFGTPGDPLWGWRFGGHHVSVNLLLRQGRIAAVTPTFFGTDPAASPLLAGVLRPLGGPEDLARELMQSLTVPERAQATLHPRAISDIVSGNRPQVRPGNQMLHMQELFRGRFTAPRLVSLVDQIDDIAESGSGYTEHDHAQLALGARTGLAAGDMSPEHRRLLRALITTYTDRSPIPVAEAHRRRYLRDDVLDGVHFGWAGDIEPGRAH
ncbi:MAG: uncharacterized protein K0R68_1697 [Mycobacterium sp.]|nr:uncharacterized protein [Mycobacterium sp.]